VGMPIMTGYESTRHIRAIETERQLAYAHQNLIYSPYLSVSSTSSRTGFPFYAPSLSSSSNSNSPSAFEPSELDKPRLKSNRPSLIIALTGFSSQKDQEMAFEAGMDIFMTKPVRFREVGRILEGWVRSREQEREPGSTATREKEVLDEAGNGAKRSG
jgi:CheY-like chemotaxis protein